MVWASMSAGCNISIFFGHKGFIYQGLLADMVDLMLRSHSMSVGFSSCGKRDHTKMIFTLWYAINSQKICQHSHDNVISFAYSWLAVSDIWLHGAFLWSYLYSLHVSLGIPRLWFVFKLQIHTHGSNVIAIKRRE